MPLPALAAVAKAAAPMLKKAALKAAKKKAVSTAMNAMRPKEEEQKSMKKEYRDGGRKPLKKLKGAIQKANHKAGAVKNRLEKKVLDAVKRKKAEKGMKYENGGKLSKSKRPMRMEKMMKYNRVGAPGDKKTKEMLKRVTKGSVGDMELRYTTGKSAAQLFDAIDKSNQVPNKALAKKTEDFGREGKKTYYEGNPGGLKGKTKGKGGNVGAGVKVKKKRRR